MNPTSPAATVLDEVATWAGVTTQPTPRGATAIVFEGHELGHVHADRSTLDLPLPAAQARTRRRVGFLESRGCDSLVDVLGRDRLGSCRALTRRCVWALESRTEPGNSERPLAGPFGLRIGRADQAASAS
jgi:hypothetical protein